MWISMWSFRVFQESSMEEMDSVFYSMGWLIAFPNYLQSTALFLEPVEFAAGC